MSEIADIIARLERADPNSDLDLAIWNACSSEEWRFVDAGVITCDRYGIGAAGNPVCSLDPFTHSIDAALTLVPEGSRWLVGAGAPYSSPWANVRMGNIGPFHIAAATPAIALCIAALKARQALSGS
jgi:hypothetical protein